MASMHCMEACAGMCQCLLSLSDVGRGHIIPLQQKTGAWLECHVTRENVSHIHVWVLEKEHSSLSMGRPRVSLEDLPLFLDLGGGCQSMTNRCAIIAVVSCHLDVSYNGMLLTNKLVLGGAETECILICRSRREKSTEICGTR